MSLLMVRVVDVAPTHAALMQGETEPSDESDHVYICLLLPRVHNNKSVQLPFGFYTRYLDRMT